MRIWIQRQARSAAAFAWVFSLALLAVSSATDEGSVAFSTRLARIVPLLPVPAACAYALTVFRARRRGEALALEALGVDPRRWQRWVALGALIPTALGALALALGLDSSGLFPVASSAEACRREGAAFLCARAGLRLEGTAVTLWTAEAPLGPSSSARELAAALAVWCSGMLVVWWSGAALLRPRYALYAVLLLLSETVLCQAIGAGRLHPWYALLAPALAAALSVLTAALQTTTAREPKLRA